MPYVKTAIEAMEMADQRWATWLKEAEIVPLTREMAEQIVETYDKELRGVIEGAFPYIKENRETREFRDWLWQVKVERDPRVEAAKREMGRPYSDVKGRGSELIDAYVAAKNTVMAELTAGDMEALRIEWRKGIGAA
jgi:hypothetical protein